MPEDKKLNSVGVYLSGAVCAVILAATCLGPVFAPEEAANFTGQMVTHEEESEEHRRIQAYCRTSWKNSKVRQTDWDDCTQDVLLRLYSSLTREQLGIALNNPDSLERRELNRAVWATSQRWRRQHRHQQLTDEYTTAGRSDSWPEVMSDLQRVQKAATSDNARLTPTQRDIIRRSSEGASVADIAHDLKLLPQRVSDEKYKAIQKLRDHFARMS